VEKESERRMTTVVEAIAAILVLSGVTLIAIPRIEGIYIMIVAQILWTVYAIIPPFQLFFLGQSFVLFIINFFALYSWRKKGVGYERKDSKGSEGESVQGD
jgi:hypothetical protein